MAIGYTRNRAVLGGKWEGHFTTVVLLLGGTVLVTLIVLVILRALGAIT